MCAYERTIAAEERWLARAGAVNSLLTILRVALARGATFQSRAVDVNVTKQSFKFPLKNPSCHPNVYFCSASDGSNVVKVFQAAVLAAQQHKDRPDADADFTESVLETLDYFKEKEKKEKDEAAAAK